MPTIQVKAELTANELLLAVQQLGKKELEQFVYQVVNLRAKREAPSLPKAEAELLKKINRGIPKDIRERYKVLIEKRRDEELTPKEYKELLKLSDEVEKIEAQRVEYLAEMAMLRQTSMADLMKSLGIQAPAYV
jgi:hypothetical protein